MGYMRHHAIVVTGMKEWHADHLQTIYDAHAAATTCGCAVTSITDAVMNGYASFMVAPDGSKEGWRDSDQGDEARAKFIDWLHGAQWFDWAEVAYSGDDHGAVVERHAWDENRPEEE
jgi:hypothetical protein